MKLMRMKSTVTVGRWTTMRIFSKATGRMTKKARTLTFRCVCLLCSLLFCAIALYGAYAFGFRVNLTRSMPTGVWRVVPFSPSGRAGSAVLVQSDKIPAGSIYAGKMSFLKQIAAVAGDRIDYNASKECITVNGTPVADSKIFAMDRDGRAMPRPAYPLTVPDGCVWLSSAHVHGYDSRYYGAISADAVLSGARLVWGFK
jgi:conjugative transfer signal peptidase TraF